MTWMIGAEKARAALATAGCLFLLILSAPGLSPARDSAWTGGEDISEGAEVVDIEAVFYTGQGPDLDSAARPEVRGGEESVERSRKLSDELEGVSGVLVLEEGGDEGRWLLMIRGGDPASSPVYLDGILVSDPLGEPADLSTLPWTLARELRVYKTGAPPGYPVSGTSGLMDLRLREARLESGYHASAAIDTLASTDVSASITEPFLGGGARFGTAHQWGAGRFEYENRAGTPEDDSDDESALRNNNEFADHDVSIKLDRRLGRSRAYASGYLHQSSRGLAGPDYLGADHAFARTRLGMAYAGVKTPGLGLADLDAEARIHYLVRRREFRDGKGELGPPREDDDLWERAGLDIYLDYYGIPRNSLSAYLGVYRNTYTPKSDMNPLADKMSYARTGLYFTLADEVSLFDGRLLVRPQARYAFDDSDYEGPTFTGAVEGGELSTGCNQIGGDINLRFKPAGSITLAAKVGQYHRPPGFLHEYGDAVSLTGNPDLSPETVLNQEIAIVYDPGPVWNIDLLKAGVTLFQNVTTDRLAWVEAGGGMMRAENIGGASMTGAEVSLSLNLRDLVAAHIAYAWLDTKTDSNIPLFDGKELVGAPENSFHLDASLYRSYGRVYYEGFYQGPRYMDLENEVKEEARLVHNLGVAYFRGEYSVGIEVTNLANDRSREVLGYPLPGTRYEIYLEVNQ